MNTHEQSAEGRASKRLKPFAPSVAPLANSVEQVAARLGLGRTTVFALIKDGQLASIKVGSRRLVPEAAVEAFLARCMASAS